MKPALLSSLALVALLAAPSRAIVDKEFSIIEQARREAEQALNGGFDPGPAEAPAAAALDAPFAFLPSSIVKRVGTEEFEAEVVRARVPVLVYFYSDDSEISRTLAPAVEEIARQSGARVKVVRVDARRDPRPLHDLLPKHAAEAVLPALYLFQGGQAQKVALVPVTDGAGNVTSVKLARDGPAAPPAAPTASAPHSKWKAPPAFASGSIVKKVTAATYDAEVNKSPIPVLVDYYADWCGHCHEWAPIMEWMARLYAGKLKIVRVDTEEEEALSKAAPGSSIPRFYYVKNGRARKVWMEAVNDDKGRRIGIRFVNPSPEH